MHESSSLSFLPGRSLVLAFWTLAALTVAATPVDAREFFIHEATSSNTFLHVTQMDHPAVNDDPDAFIIIQQVFNPVGDLNGVENPAETGISYSPTSGRWSIENQGLSAMPQGTRFFVMVDPAGGIVHENTPANTVGAVSTIDSSPANGRPVAFWLATRVRTRTGASGGFNDHPITLDYDAVSERWRVINQDGGTMPSSGGFNIEGFPTFAPISPKFSSGSMSWNLIVASASTTTGELTRIEAPLLESRPSAFVFVTHQGLDVPNRHPISVAYDFFEQKWAIVNLDGSPLPLGARFTVGFVQVLFLDGFEVGNPSRWSSSTP